MSDQVINPNKGTAPKRLFENLMTMDELHNSLGGVYSKSSIYKWVLGGIPHKKIRNKLWFNPSEVREWLERS